ncbi:MAG: heme exporter protein CcmD [Rhodobacteraceae bacterium]|nr:heme exporter protein CcmD [Paracoccaceae bacterium]
MMIDLGKYAATVLTAYGVSLAFLLVLVGVTLRRSFRVRKALEAQERRTGVRHG